MTHAVREPRVAVVVLNWNGKMDTLRCLASLNRATYPNLEVIVVDNGSTDGSSAAVADAHPEAVLLQLNQNLGYTGGNNAGVDRALKDGADIVGVLNNDTVVDPGFLEPLVECVGHDPMTFASPRIVYLTRPDQTWFSGAYLDSKVGIFYHRDETSLTPPERAAEVRHTPALTGCCLLAHRQLWERVGTFDDRYFLIFEDADWCARAIEAGARAVVVTRSTIAHAVSASFEAHTSTVADYYYLRNGLLYIREHSRSRTRASVYLAARVLRGSVRQFLRAPDAQHARSLLANLEGACDFLRGRFGRRPRQRRSRCGV